MRRFYVSGEINDPCGELLVIDADVWDERKMEKYGEVEDLVGGRIVGIDRDGRLVVEVNDADSW